MPVPQLIIRGQRVVLTDSIAGASIHIYNGRITRITSYEDVTSNCGIVEAGDASIVMPGLVDSRAHQRAGTHRLGKVLRQLRKGGRSRWDNHSG